MIRLITAGAIALLFAGCTADAPKETGEGGNTPASNTPASNETKVVAAASSKFELGKPI
ncbi:MAG: hypothetical protein ACI89X_000147 [Planctomycetota bacterium]|jgi:hypothetical protein